MVFFHHLAGHKLLRPITFNATIFVPFSQHPVSEHYQALISFFFFLKCRYRLLFYSKKKGKQHQEHHKHCYSKFLDVLLHYRFSFQTYFSTWYTWICSFLHMMDLSKLLLIHNPIIPYLRAVDKGKNNKNQTSNTNVFQDQR